LLRKRLEGFSLLDFDDLLILTLFYEECSFKEVSSFLKVTRPAISHRLKKYIDVFGFDLFCLLQKQKILTPEGEVVAIRAKRALCVLLGLDEKNFVLRNSRQVVKSN